MRLKAVAAITKMLNTRSNFAITPQTIIATDTTDKN